MTELYRNAEAKLWKQKKDQKSNAQNPKSEINGKPLFHELQVQQVELKMQNTDLRTAAICPIFVKLIFAISSPICGRPVIRSSSTGSRPTLNSGFLLSATSNNATSRWNYARRSNPGMCSGKNPVAAARSAMWTARSNVFR